MAAAGFFAMAALLAVVPAVAAARTHEDTVRENAFATHRAGSWQATAALFGTDYTFGPEYQCLMSTSGASLLQRRPNEASEMPSYWTFRDDEDGPQISFQVSTVSIDGKRFEVTALPWRLSGPPGEDGIVLTFDRAILSFRRKADHPWLPFVYLMPDMLAARSFELTYVDSNDEQKRVRRKRIMLDGFREVARWCGQQLLRDRMDESRVRDLVR